ncbi:NUDIX hydrolase [Paenibacillus tengchongensis]|uniref:NUDIX hydrolase n=1 Tax=Paenibacillus tengchongensis TaxID=2608684 RepID=UPI00124C0702|nr:NUDIX domain-containing protein [Paenibacillus tengchongensis]
MLNQGKVFGKRESGIDYTRRGAVYAVIFSPSRLQVAVVRTPAGYFLPGGGVEAAESPEECLCRECLEEIGYVARIGEYIGQAERFFQSPARKEYIWSDAAFYIAELSGEPQPPSETDHELLWLTRAEAEELLYHEHQAWSVEEAFRMRRE